MSARRLKDELSRVAERLLDTLAAPDDVVVFDLAFGNSEVPCQTEEGTDPITALVPSISIYLSVRCPEYSGTISGCADLPVMVAGTPEGFSVGLEKLWDEISFRRIALSLDDVSQSAEGILAEPGDPPDGQT